MEASTLLDPRVVTLEAGNHRLDATADEIVVADEGFPVDRTVREEGAADAGHDGGLRPEFRGGRFVDAGGGMHHAHGILHGHRLPAACLIIGLGAPEAGKDQRGLPVDHMTAVQVGRDMNGHVAVGESLPCQVGVGGGGGEVPAHAEEEARLPLRHRLDGVDHRIAVLPGSGEPEVFLQGAQEGLGREFRDTHGPVTLDIAVPAHRAGARTGTANVPPQ